MRMLGLMLVLLSAACVPIVGSSRITPEWLEGRWTLDRDPLNCSFIGTIDYHAAGTYNSHDEGGSWRIDGNRITEVSTWVRRDPDGRLTGRSQVDRIYRIGPNSLLRIFDDGRWVQLRRCERRS